MAPSPAQPQATTDVPHLLQRAVNMHQGGRLREAAKLYEQVLAAQPDNFDALHLYGVLMHQGGQPAEALRLIGQALRANAKAPAAHSNYGLVLAVLERDAEALESYDRAIALKPDYAEAINNRGNVLRKLGRTDEAIASFERAIALRPGYPEALNNRGNALLAAQRTAEALKSYEEALAQRPSYVDALVNRAEALRLLARPDAALASLDRALALKPDQPAALKARAQLRQARGDDAGALTDLDRLAALAPNDAETHNNRGNALIGLNRLDEALAAYDRALAINPDYTFALVNRGSALRYLSRPDEARDCFERAIELAPDLADAHWNMALLDLSRGDFARGLPGYEWRWRRGLEAPRGFAQPLWQGEDLTDKTILLHAEQGLGDSIQMLRYLPLVAANGGKIVLELPGPLLPLITDPAITLVRRGDALPAFDLQCPLMSLPLACGTTLETIPAAVPYLTVPADRLETWRAKLAAIAAPRVGLVWSGKPEHVNDHNRSLPLKQLAPVLAVPGVQFVSLQRETRESDLTEAARWPNLTRFDDALADFADTAALIEGLDLVIAVDTAVAHLAGALGKPVWILISHIQDWRWFTGRSDNPWYPSARLFRQSTPGDWDGTIANLAATLREFT